MTDTRLQRDDRCVVMREIAGETFLVPIRGTLAELQDLFVLDGVGQWVWERLDGRTSIDDLTAQATEQFDVTPEAARDDLARFLDELREAGLVLTVEPGRG